MASILDFSSDEGISLDFGPSHHVVATWPDDVRLRHCVIANIHITRDYKSTILQIFRHTENGVAVLPTIKDP